MRSWVGRLAALGALWLLGVAAVAPASATTAVLEPIRDNTLIETLDGSLSNGAGPALFAGRTSQTSGSIRRALLSFDVAGSVPAGAVVESATLRLHMTAGPSSSSVLSLHRVLADWGEGTSSVDGGRGAPSTTGDATWIHSFYDSVAWTQAGADFAPAASADVFTTNGSELSWASSAMVADVQAWLDDPGSSYGWVLLGDEAASGTVVKFASREFATVAERPSLTLEYARVPEPGAAGLLALGLLLVGLDRQARRRRERRFAHSCQPEEEPPQSGSMDME